MAMSESEQKALDLTPKESKGFSLFGCCVPKNGKVDTTEAEREETQDRELDIPEISSEANGAGTFSNVLTIRQKTPNNFVVAFWEFLLTFVFLGLTSAGKSSKLHQRALAPAPEEDEEGDDEAVPTITPSSEGTTDDIPDMSTS